MSEALALSQRETDPAISRRRFLAATAGLAGSLLSLRLDAAAALASPTAIDTGTLRGFVRGVAAHSFNQLRVRDADEFVERIHRMATGDVVTAHRIGVGTQILADAAPQLADYEPAEALRELIRVSWPWKAHDLANGPVDHETFRRANDRATTAALKAAGVPPNLGASRELPAAPLVPCLNRLEDDEQTHLGYTGVAVLVAACDSLRPGHPIEIPTAATAR